MEVILTSGGHLCCVKRMNVDFKICTTHNTNQLYLYLEIILAVGFFHLRYTAERELGKQMCIQREMRKLSMYFPDERFTG